MFIFFNLVFVFDGFVLTKGNKVSVLLMEPPPDRFPREHRSVPLGSWFAKLKILSRVKEDDPRPVAARSRSTSMPALVLGQHRTDRAVEDSDSSDLNKSSDGGKPQEKQHQQERHQHQQGGNHAFAVAIAGRYTTKHRPIGLAGLLTLDSTEETPDSESSRGGRAEQHNNTNTGSDDETQNTYRDDEAANTYRDVVTHTEASESGESSARGNRGGYVSRSRASSMVSEDSPRSEEYVKPSEDRYAFVKGFGKPVGIPSVKL